jgi:hypothetical protein
VGVRKATADSLNAAGREKNRFRSALLNTGGDSKASSSEALKIFMRAMGDLVGQIDNDSRCWHDCQHESGSPTARAVRFR